MTGVPSSAAVVHITVSPIVLQKDLVLATLFQAISQLPQVTIQQDKKIPLLYTAEGILLKQRNAIVRALIGTGLHGALDHTSSSSSSSIATAAAAGGHWSRRHASPTSAMAWASMLYWMTDVKEQIIQQRNKTNSDNNTTGNNNILERIVSELSEHLKDHAFLVPHTAMPTVADFDVALALAMTTTTTTTLPSNNNNNNNMTLVDKYLNVMRWMKTTLTSLQQQMQPTSHGGCQDSRSNNTKNPILLLPALSLPASIVSKYVSSSQSQSQSQSSVPPIFFDGTEDATAILQQLHAAAEAAAAKTEDAWKATNKKQQQQQQQQQHAGESKKEKKKKQQQPAGGAAGAADAAADYDISALDIRVGQIIKIWPHESAEKLYCEDIDLGNGEIRQIASGLRPFYAAPDLLQGQKVLVLMNLKKRNLVGFPSHGMVLCASNADHSKVELVVPPAEAALGQRVWFGSSGSSSTSSDKQKDPEPENKVQKKKLMELLLPDLKTNDQGIVVWKGAEARTSAGVVKAVNGMANAQVA